MTKKNEGNVHELQKSFYELPVALAYLRQNKWGRGLRLLDFIYGHFKAIDEEQLEFFSYALRKYSMINFMKMVRLNIIDVGKNPYFIMGNANYLKYAMAYQRKLAVEAKINEVPKKVKNHELKKQKKLKDKFDEANAVDASEEVVKNLDLNGENLLNNLKLADIAKMVAICQPANDKQKELSHGTLLDYYLDIKNPLQAVRAYFNQPKDPKNTGKMFLREMRLHMLLSEEISAKKKHEKVISLLEVYLKQIFGDRTAETIKKTYTDKYGQLKIGEFTLILAKMYETGQHIKDTVEELEAYVKTNVVANATTFGVQEKLLLLRAMKLWGVNHDIILEFYKNSQQNIGFFDALNTVASDNAILADNKVKKAVISEKN